MKPVELLVVETEHPDLHALIEKLDADLLARYGDADEIFGVDFNDPDVKQMVFVVAYAEGRAVGCGGIRPYRKQGYAELKRLYVDPACRNRGVASRILAFLEGEALRLGFTVMRLETGAPQPESIQLYAKYGYKPIPRFGPYADSESSLCFEKPISFT
ncbi:GNAT family N-acetyltransferase [Paenibacillus protaetiae]|uniref:GNAT family N-acetyltransferase n=1 Tax=Paenibacillus protaetiae TaxID=2509456 RepID=A0A4P6ETU0_9BACL|nr:GNAT family N-acetyltransferase [Paenibacillus protaetiae]QAY66620.1 GNAT family N-acetyltransferase [Paenibacillus protaetiae]